MLLRILQQRCNAGMIFLHIFCLIKQSKRYLLASYPAATLFTDRTSVAGK